MKSYSFRPLNFNIEHISTLWITLSALADTR